MFAQIADLSFGPYSFVREQLRKRKAARMLEEAELTESIRQRELFTSTYCPRGGDAGWTELSWPRASARTSSCYNPRRLQRTAHPDPGVKDILVTSLAVGQGQNGFLEDANMASMAPSPCTSTVMCPHLLICTTFWRSSLTLNNFHGHSAPVDFGSLWPSEEDIRAVLHEAQYESSLGYLVSHLLRLCLRVGPLRVLKALVEENIVDTNTVLDGGRTLLHVACINENMDAVLYLCALNVNTDARDKEGKTARDVCPSEGIKKLLPWPTPERPAAKHRKTSPSTQNNKERCSTAPASPPQPPQPLTAEMRERIFDLFYDIDAWEEVQVLMQLYRFDVNKERNDEQDLLIHVAVKRGISHVAALVSLCCHQGASVNALDQQGCTPLMLAVCNEDELVADFLVCVLGADINSVNPENGWAALHYAANLNYHNLVSLLVKRGANVNMETEAGLRPDDLAKRNRGDCSDIIERGRNQRISQLVREITKGKLLARCIYDEDLFMVDSLGDTLLMTAARHNQPEILASIIKRRCAPIDAQNYRTGQTALSIAASKGHVEIIHILLRSNAAASIYDMSNLNAVHHAVLEGQEEAVKALLEYPQTWRGLQTALDLARIKRIRIIIKRTIAKRQNKLVTPALFECAMTGKVYKLSVLLEEGDNINPSSSSFDWPLYIAAANGHLNVVSFLYERGGDISCQHETNRNTVLHVACAGNHHQVVNFLLEHHGKLGPVAKRYFINITNSDGKTALQMAANEGYIRIVESLLNHGASAAISDNSGHLYHCHRFQGIQVLLDQARQEHGQEIFGAISKTSPASRLQECFVPEFDHNLRNANGDTALMVACFHGNTEVLEFLLQSAVPMRKSLAALTESMAGTLSQWDLAIHSGSKAGSRTSHSGGQLQGYRFDLEDGPTLSNDLEGYASPDAETDSAVEADYLISRHQTEMPVYGRLKDYTARTATSDLMLVSKQGMGTSAESVGAYSNESQPCPDMYSEIYMRNCVYTSTGHPRSHVCTRSTYDGATAAHRAVEGGDRTAVLQQLLLADPGVLNLPNEAGVTPLHLACKLGRRKATAFLLQQPGIDVNFRTLAGSLPDELTSIKSLRKLIQGVRQASISEILNRGQEEKDTSHSGTASQRAPSIAGSDVSFDGLNTRFLAMKARWLSREREQLCWQH